MLLNWQKTNLRKKANRLFEQATDKQKLLCKCGSEVIGDYKIPYRHVIEPDSKTPTDWINSCLFHYVMKGMKGDLDIMIADD